MATIKTIGGDVTCIETIDEIMERIGSTNWKSPDRFISVTEQWTTVTFDGSYYTSCGRREINVRHIVSIG